ncbi:MAG TPA: Xaa-Pro peptidase family protein [Geobacteraceae bacterium]
MRITPATELEFRCNKLQALMAEVGLDAVIILQSADLYYFTGTIQSGNLYVPVSGQPLYLVRRDAGRARMESGLKEVLPFGSMKEIPAILADYGYPMPTKLGMENDVLPVTLWERYRKAFPAAEFSDASPLIRRVRMKKSRYEIHLLQDAAQQVDKVNRRVREVLREGMSDVELAAELEYVARRVGHPGPIRMRVFNGEMCFGHTFSGADSAVPAYTDTPLGGLGVSPSFGQGASWKPIGRGEPVTVDFAGSVDGYLVDQTRMFAIGAVSDRLRQGYDAMLQVQERLKAIVPEQPSWGEVYDDCCRLATELGYGDQFMGTTGAQVSFIGHGVGVEIDEFPFLARGFNDQYLEPGMVFAFEPKLVFAGEGAVGIENTFYLADDGTLKQLTFSSEEFVII